MALGIMNLFNGATAHVSEKLSETLQKKLKKDPQFLDKVLPSGDLGLMAAGVKLFFAASDLKTAITARRKTVADYNTYLNFEIAPQDADLQIVDKVPFGRVEHVRTLPIELAQEHINWGFDSTSRLLVNDIIRLALTDTITENIPPERRLVGNERRPSVGLKKALDQVNPEKRITRLSFDTMVPFKDIQDIVSNELSFSNQSLISLAEKVQGYTGLTTANKLTPLDRLRKARHLNDKQVKKLSKLLRHFTLSTQAEIDLEKQVIKMEFEVQQTTKPSWSFAERFML